MDVMMVGHSKGMIQSFPEHQHGYWEILFNTQGSGVMKIDGKEYAFEPGVITILPPRIPHAKESAEGFYDMSIFIKDFRPVGNAAFRILRDDQQGTFLELMVMAERFYKENGFYEQAVLNVIGDLIYQVLVLLYVKGQKKDPRVDGVMELMQNNLNNPDFDLSTAIESTGYNKGYFRKIFKEFTGSSPVNYFQKLRIEYAKSLMNQYGKSRNITDIALSCGFKDPLYFSRVFKKLEGMSPSDYVKQQSSLDLTMIEERKKL